MSGGTIDTFITIGVMLGAGTYASPLTITSLGTIATGYGTTALTASVSGGYVVNHGSVTGGGGGGVGIALSNGTLENAGTISGSNTGGNVGVLLTSGTLINSSLGTITGGTKPPNGGGAYGDSGVQVQSGTVTNYGVINGGYGNGGFGANGGSGVALSAGELTNDGTISGGREGRGVSDSGGSVVNNGLIAAGYGPEFGIYLNGGGNATNNGTVAGGYAGSGAYVAGGTTLTNGGLVMGGARSNDNGGTGVLVQGGSLFNAGTVIGGAYGYGVRMRGGQATNLGTIEGGAGGNRGVYNNLPGILINGGTIIGGSGALANVGVEFLGGGTIVDSGTIIGGNNGTKDALTFGSAGLLKLAPGAAFVGAVTASSSQRNELEFAVGTGTLDMGTSFSGFGTLVFDPGAAWSLEGDVAELASGETINGLNGGDTLILDGFAATTSSYVPGTGLEISDGTTTETLDITGGFSTAEFSVEVMADQTLISVACFRAGTMIATAAGEQAVETLRIGDAVQTAARTLRPIRWIGRRSYDARFVAGRRDILPILIAAGALADGVPARDLFVSPKHAMFIDDVLIPAELLANGASVVQVAAVTELTYVHIELDTHDILLADGAPSESFVDDGSRMMFQNAHEFSALLSDGRGVAAVFCAPRVEHGERLAAVRRRIAVRCGLVADHAGDAAEPGALDGRIDVLDHDVVSGWAFDATRSHTPVRLEVLVDGLVVGTTTANVYRRDLEVANKGNGRCAFLFRLPHVLSADVDHSLQIRRVGDGAALLGCPRLLAADPAHPGPLSGRIDMCSAVTVEGWALDAAAPDVPVRLEILEGNRVLGQVLANRYREDLRQAGKGGGRCAFIFSFDRGKASPNLRRIAVRRATDHALLSGPMPGQAAA